MKYLVAKIVNAVSYRLYIKLSYLHNRGRFPDLKNPKDISEIILSTMYCGKVLEYSRYVDKIRVRDFYGKMGYNQYLPKIYGSWMRPEEIDFNELPDAFALKTNHGCGNHYICKNRCELNIEKAIITINRALKTKYGLAEMQYKSIDPIVYCEEYIDDGSEDLPNDYKFMSVDGEVKCILVVTERRDGAYKLMTYSKGWEELDYVKPYYISRKKIEKPKNLTLMINIAEHISEMFEFVRVDFYDLGNKIYLGELTFTPQGGIMSYFTNQAIREMGRK